MKRILFIGALAVIACQPSPQKKMLAEIDKYVKENFKDPASYEQIEFKISDTVLVKDEIQGEEANIEYYKAKIEDENKNLILAQKNVDLATSLEVPQYELDGYKRDLDEIKSDIIKYQDYINESSRVISDLKNLNPNSIYKLYALVKYRAKNGFGALDKSESKLIFNDSLRLISFDE